MRYVLKAHLRIKQFAPPRFSTLNRVKIQREKLNMHPWRNWQTRMVQVAPLRCKFISASISCKLWIKHLAPPRFSTLNRVKIQREKLNMRIWRNWQTRMVQVHMNANSCRFKSCYPHHEKLDFIGLFSFFLCINYWQTHNLWIKISCIFTTN